MKKSKKIVKLKIDFGSGYNPNKDYKACDITWLPNLDYVYDQENNAILGCEDNSVDEFYLRNVVHHIPNMEKTFSCLLRYLKADGEIKIIDVRREYFKQNVILDILWYRYVTPRYEVWFSTHYRNYFKVLENLGMERVSYFIQDEKEVSVWRRLSKNLK